MGEETLMLLFNMVQAPKTAEKRSDYGHSP